MFVFKSLKNATRLYNTEFFEDSGRTFGEVIYKLYLKDYRV